MPQAQLVVAANSWTLLASNVSVVTVVNTSTVRVAVRTVNTGSSAPANAPTNADITLVGVSGQTDYSRSTTTAVDVYGYGITYPTSVLIDTP
jgi:hypothetical protein